MKTRISVFLLLIPSFLLAEPQSNSAPVRVALVSTCGGEAAGNALALAEAGLSKEGGVVLVERSQIERILQEQQLWRCGLSEARQAVAVGKLLGVEVFAAVENFPDSHDALGVVVFDATTGAKLSDFTVEGATAPERGDSIRNAVRVACRKRQRRTAGQRTVCVAAVRNADMPRELDSVCEALARLLQRRLVQSADITVLERERLEEINRERVLPTSEPVGDLLAALTLLEFEFGKSSSASEIKATLFLSDAGGAALGKISAVGSQTNMAGLVEGLLDSVTRELAIAPIARKLDRAKEASRFHREAQFLADHNYFSRGLEAAEAACALEPASEVYQRTLASSLVQAALSLLQTRSVVAPTNNASPQNAAPPELMRSLRLINRALAIQKVDVMKYMKQAAPFEGGPDADTQSLFETLQRQFRDELLRSNRTALVTNLHRFQQFTYWVNYDALPNLQCLSPTARAWTSDSIEVISRWLEFAQKYPPFWDLEAGPPYYSGASVAVNRLLAWPFVRTCIQNPERKVASERWKLSADDYSRWNALYESMLHHSAPVVQMYGKIGRLAVDMRSTALTTNEAVRRMAAMVGDVKQILNGLPPDAADSLRLLYYRTALDAIDVLPPEYLDPESRWAEYTHLLDFMCYRRELAEPVISMATRGWGATFEVHPAPWTSAWGGEGRLPASHTAALLQNLDRVEALFNSPDARLLGGDRESFRKQLAGTRHQLMLQQPQLAKDVPRPWMEARLVFEVCDGLERIGEIIVRDNVAYLIGLGYKDGSRFVQLVSVSIPDGSVRMLGRAQHNWDEINNLGAVITGVCVHDDKIFVGTRRDGVFIFPADGGSPQHLTTADGLPSNWVRSLAVLNDKLFLGLGEHEGFLIAYDFKTRDCNVIASSRRKEKRSPFDDISPPFAVRYLRSDPMRQRVIALISAPVAPSGEQLAGFWQINPKSGELSQLLESPGGARWPNPNWLSPLRNDRLLLFQWDPWSIVAFDLQSDKAKLLYAANRFPPHHPLQPTEETVTAPLDRSAPFLLVDGSLWTGATFGRISRGNPTGESFPPLPGDRNPLLAFGMLGLETVGNGRQVLVVKRTQVWLLTLPGE